MNRTILISASILGIFAVILGAFAAHGLGQLISDDALSSFETGVRYQMYHAIVLLFIGSTSIISSKAKQMVFYFIVFGLFLFSGSIYALATNELSGFDFKIIGFITPIGGLLLIISWFILMFNFIKIKKD